MAQDASSDKRILKGFTSGTEKLVKGAGDFVGGTLNTVGDAVSAPFKLTQDKTSYEIFKFKRKIYDIEKTCTFDNEWLTTAVFSFVTGTGNTHDEVLLALHEVQKEYFFGDRAKKLLRWRQYKVIDGGIEIEWDETKQGFLMTYKIKVVRAEDPKETQNMLFGRGYFRVFFGDTSEEEMKKFITSKIRPEVEDLNNTLRSDDKRYPYFKPANYRKDPPEGSKNQPLIYFSNKLDIEGPEKITVLGGEQFTAFFDTMR